MTPTVSWPQLVPEQLRGGLAARIERAAAGRGEYPPEWPAVAWLIKVMAGWRCERCGVPHGKAALGECLTVHHLDGVKSNLESWNLAALCQRCHLQVQAKVQWYRLWPWPHSDWMVPHIQQFNEWAERHGEAPFPLVEAAV